MRIVLDEVTEAENVLSSGKCERKVSTTLALLGKYFRQVQGMGEKQAYNAIMEFMNENFKNFNGASWENFIEQCARRGKKIVINRIESIGITQSELDVIKSADEKYQKLLFVLLCEAKYYNVVLRSENNYIPRYNINELFRDSRTHTRNRNEKYQCLSKFVSMGLIELSHINDKRSMRVNFVDKDGDIVLKISDFRELAYEWENYAGRAHHNKCQVCGRLAKADNAVGRKYKYCSECAKQIKREQNREHYIKFRNNQES